MKGRFARRMSRVGEAFSWRSPLILAALVTREMLRPVLYWHVWHIFETDLSRPILQAYGKDQIEVKLCSENANSEGLVEEIARMGELQPEEVKRRLVRGDLVAIGLFEQQPVGYMWIGLATGLELAYDTNWIVRPGEAVKYGSFVLPEFRGRGPHSGLNQAANSCLLERGIQKVLASISLLNPQSMSLPKHYRKAVAMTLLVVRVRGVNWTVRKSFGREIRSRFSWTSK